MLKFVTLVASMLFTLCSMAQVTDGTLQRADRSTHKAWSFGQETIRTHSKNAVNPDKKYSSQRTPITLGDGTILYGEEVYSTFMNVDDDDAIKWGVYSFPAKENTDFTAEYIHNTICANGGGAFREGKLYFVSYYEGPEPGTFLYLYFCILDVNTWEMEKIPLKGDTFSSIGLDMTYDPVGDMMYSQTFPADAASNPNGYFSLSTMNLETGLSTQIGQLDRMSMIACDMSGQMYGVRYTDGMLVKIDKGTAAVTEVGMTGIFPQYNGSGTFDMETGKLYWTTTDMETEKTGIYEIDTNSGKASLISEFAHDEQVTCLYIPQSTERCDLGDITNFSADYSKTSSTSGTITLQAPATDARGNAVSGDINILVYADGVLRINKTVAPGEVIKEELDLLTKGEHKLEAVASLPGVGKSKRTSINVWVGTDGGAAVSNLKLTKTSDTAALLTWDTPTIGEHGCPINPALVYYEIRRFPDNELITEDATGNEFTDYITDKSYRDYYYTVTSIHKGVTGGTATSNKVGFGIANEIPYNENFNTKEGYESYTIFNNNNDEGFWEFDNDNGCARYKYDTFNDGDDWLVTPGLNLGTENTYKLTFKARSEGSLYPEEIEVLLADECSVEKFNTVLVPHTYLKHDKYKEYEAVINVKKAGIYFVGFHAVTKKGQYFLYLDDVGIVDGPSAYIPGEVTDMIVKEEKGGRPSVTISFTTPKINFEKTELTEITSAKIYRNGDLIYTQENPGIGATVSYTDTEFKTGMNTYKAVCFNSFGEGLAKEVSQSIGSDIPSVPTNVKQETKDGINAIITWKAPEKGVNGAVLSPEQLTYNIVDNKDNVIAKGVNGTSYTYEVDTTDGQHTLFFNVQAVTEMGAGEYASSNFITYGKAYKGTEFKESFADSKFMTQDWFVSVIDPSPYDNEFYGRYWGLEHSSKWDRGPRPEDQNGDGGCLIAFTDFLDVSSRIISPKINVSDLKNPVLSFWYYHYVNLMPEESYSHVNETMTVEAYVDGEFVEMIADPIHLINGNGWYRYDVLLKDYVGAKDFQVAFKTHNYLSYDQHIDNIYIRDVKDNNLMVTGLSVPEVIAPNTTRSIKATVFNDGKNTAEKYDVEFMRDGEVFATVAGKDKIEFSASTVISTDITPTIAEAGKNYKYTARVVLDGDEDNSNDTSEELESSVVSNNLPVVKSLKAVTTDDGVALNWNQPEDANDYREVTDGFESYESFAIENYGDWKTVDGDAAPTYSIQNSESETGDYAYPNAGEPMAFQIFAPYEAKIDSKLWTPYLGNKMLICFDAAGTQNDDWLISPMIQGGTKVSFMAKSVTDAYGLEMFYFCCSYDTDTSDDFADISKKISVPAEWTRYEFELPADAKYFAINCVSNNSYALLIDDIQFERTEPMPLSIKGYNIYRDNVKINDALVEDMQFNEKTSEKTGHSYGVTTVYDMGESMQGNIVTPDNTGIENIGSENVNVYADGNAIHIGNANGCNITVYDTAGNLIYNTSSANGDIELGVSTGVYLVRVNGESIKIVIK